jgi:hypothetical protein
MTQTAALMPGELLGDDYRIEKAIGSGGFGITYLATETTLDRLVCIKEYFPTDFASRNGIGEAVPRSEGCGADYDWGLERFIEEARALAKFDHPNIVKVYRYFQENSTAYMVLQFEEGQSLKDWAKSLGRGARQAEIDAVLTPLLEALATLHAAQFLHRDIAPDNIIIRPDGTPVLIDFGSARGEIARQSRTVSALVKPGYSPYEQYGNDGSQQGPWSDIYALGATLYQLVTGKRPPDAPSRIVKDDFVSTAERALGAYRPGFLSAIDWALQLDIEARPQSIRAWKERLFDNSGQACPRAEASAVAAQPATPPGVTVPVQETVPVPPAPLFARKKAAGEADAPANPVAASDDGERPGLMSLLGRRRKPEPEQHAASSARDEPAADLEALPTEPPPPMAAAASKASASAQRKGWGFGWRRQRDNAPARKQTPAAETNNPPRVETAAIAAAMAEQRAGSRDIVAAPPERRRALIPSFPKLRFAGGRPRPAAPKRRPARPRRQGKRTWAPLLFRSSAALAIVGGLVYLQNSLPEYAVRGTNVATSSSAAPSSFLKRQFRPHDGKAQHVRYGNGGAWLVTTGGDETLKIWNTNWGSLIRTLELDHGRATALAVRGRMAVTGHEAGDIAVWDLDDGRRLAHFKRNEARIWSVAFASAETILAASHDWTVTLWKTTTPDAPHHVFEGHDSAVQAVAYDQTSGTIASASADKTLRLWDRSRLSHRRTLSGHKDFVTSVAFSPDGKRIVSGDLSGQVRIWRASNGSRLRRINAHDGEVNRVWFVADDDVVATTSVDGRLRFFSVRSGKTLQTFGSRGRAVIDMAVSSERKRIATVTENGWVRIWDAAILMR